MKSDDTISRQMALNLCERFNGCIPYSVLSSRDMLPSVSTEKTGRWITQWNPAHQKEYYYCSECREEYSYDGETGIKMNNYKYCPNCGARMEGVDA